MFDNIRLFTKPNNKIEEANNSWTTKTRIHCSFELNLGFGTDKVVWEEGNSIKLQRLINFHTGLKKLITNSTQKEFSFEIKKNDVIYLFNWTLEEDYRIRLRIDEQYYNSTKFILEKKFYNSEIYAFSHKFLITVVSILSKNTNNEVASFVGESFFKNHPVVNSEFKIGQKVKTIIGANVKTERTGIVINKYFHSKGRTNMYELLVDGKTLVKRYLPEDLIVIE
jgi:hypothetical protein